MQSILAWGADTWLVIHPDGDDHLDQEWNSLHVRVGEKERLERTHYGDLGLITLW